MKNEIEPLRKVRPRVPRHHDIMGSSSGSLCRFAGSAIVSRGILSDVAGKTPARRGLAVGHHTLPDHEVGLPLSSGIEVEQHQLVRDGPRSDAWAASTEMLLAWSTAPTPEYFQAQRPWRSIVPRRRLDHEESDAAAVPGRGGPWRFPRAPRCGGGNFVAARVAVARPGDPWRVVLPGPGGSALGSVSRGIRRSHRHYAFWSGIPVDG